MIRNPSRVARWYRLLTIGLLVLPTALFLAVARITYTQALDDARERLERAARIAQEHAARVVETNEVLSRAIFNAIDGRGDDWIAADAAPLHAQLERLAADVPQLHSLWIWSAQGRPLVSSRFAALPRIDVSDREYFVWVRDHPGGGWFVSRPLVSRSNGETFFNFSRRREAPDGSFLGAVSVSLYPAYFSNFYEELGRREPGLAVELVRADGQVIATTSRAATTLRRADGALVRPMAEGVASGELAGAASTGSSAARVAFRKVGRLPLYVVVGLGPAEILVHWWRDMAALLAVGFPIALGLVLLARLTGRYSARLETAMHALRDEADQRSKAEAALQQAQKLEALGQITGGVAHDFNNVLMVIQSSAELAKRLEDLGKPAGQQHGAILRAVKTGTQLTRQLLTFSRRQPLQVVTLSLEATLPPLLSLIQTTVGGRIEVKSHWEGDIGNVRVDIAEFELAMINLAVNARDAMHGSGTLTVRVQAQPPGPAPALACPHVRICVKDTGEGVPPEILGRLFEPFFTTKPPGRGTGLGLSQVYGFATQAGGTVAIESEAGQGTTVSMRLPSVADEAGVQADANELPRLSGSLLLVEDNDDIAASLVPLLQQIGLRVERCASADAALAKLAARRAEFDVVLSDIVMPGSASGVDLAAHAAQAHADLPVVLMSGYSAELQRALDQGMTVLPKPCAPQALAAALQKALARARGAPSQAHTPSG